jgi:type II secretory pathway component PulC
MDAEEQLRRLRQTPQSTPDEKKRKMVSSILLTLATLLSVLFLVYAFVQKLEADHLRVEAENLRVESVRQERLAKEAQAMAELQQAAAEKAKAEALQALADCKRNKR